LTPFITEDLVPVGDFPSTGSIENGQFVEFIAQDSKGTLGGAFAHPSFSSNVLYAWPAEPGIICAIGQSE
jgi:hypothetical protein